MIDSGVFDLVVGILFIFLVFSVIVSGINEGITRLMAWRSRHLWRSLRRLLDGEDTSLTTDQRPNAKTAPGPKLTDQLYAHPLIRQLEGRLPTERSRLSKIPTTDFSRALIDLFVPDGNGATSVDDVRTRLQQLPEGSPLKVPLLAILSEAGEELGQLREDIGEWFDTRMEALSRAYRRHAKWLLLVVGLGVAMAFNVDAIGAGQRLYRDEALRSAVAQQADAVVENCQDATDITDCTRRQAAEVDQAIRLPVGWPDSDGVDALQVLGWLIAGLALGQGAPFWFDLLRKARELRS